MTELIFHGQDGIIEAHYTQGRTGYAAVVCAPHPLYAGDFDNNIVRLMYDTFAKAGHSVMRFNYRGVGRSDGRFMSTQNAETTDANYAVDWLLDNNPGCKGVYMAGFSFGAYVASQVAVRRPEAAGLLCVSHPYTLYHSDFIEDWVPRSLFIDGECDDFVGRYKLLDNNIQRVTIKDTDHFMTGKMDELEIIVREWIYG